MSLIGLDLDQRSIAQLRETFDIDDIQYGDAEELDSSFGTERFDVILAGDVIEHMSNIGRFFTAAR